MARASAVCTDTARSPLAPETTMALLSASVKSRLSRVERPSSLSAVALASQDSVVCPIPE